MLCFVKSRELAGEIAADILVHIWRNRQPLPDIDLKAFTLQDVMVAMIF